MPKRGKKASLAPDMGVPIPRGSSKELGVSGLRMSDGQILAEVQRVFRYPHFISVVREMRNNPTVGAAMNVWRMAMARVEWDVEAPPGASKKAQARAEAVRSMMSDMDHSWSQFIEEVIEYLEYGFKPFEIVGRRRLRRTGSKHNDGLRGIRKLAPRNPETIAAWRFDDSGSELKYIEQSLSNTEKQHLLEDRVDKTSGNIHLDVKKLLLFTASSRNGNPEGESIFKNIYLAHKQMTLLQEQELLGIAGDRGLLNIGLPPRYLAEDASDSEKAVVTYFQQYIDKFHRGELKGLVTPRFYDPESKQPIFTYELIESKGVVRYDTESVIKRLQQDILQALCVDILKQGADGGGSFSLAESKTRILTLALLHRLGEIRSVLNQQLMRWIYEQNGWEMDEMAEFVHGEVETIDLDTFSKGVQRLWSVGAIEMDREAANRVRFVLGLSKKPADEPIDTEALPANMSQQKTRAGDGMASPTGNGTSQDPFGGGDTSTSNKENT